MDDYYEFTRWVANYLCGDKFEDNPKEFAELARNRLYWFGFIRYDGDLNEWIWDEVEE